MDQWTYDSLPFASENIGNFVGYVYLIENTVDGRKYVGKKSFTKSKTYQKKGKKKRKRIESDWIDYFGSSEAVQEDVERLGRQVFRRTILHLCASKAEMSYWEAYEQFSRHVLLSDEYYNDWLSVRVRRAHLKTLRPSENSLAPRP